MYEEKEKNEKYSEKEWKKKELGKSRWNKNKKEATE